LFIEHILEDLYVSDNSFNITILRYFNPVGAHESGLLGEDPNGIPNNLMPYIVKVACGELECLSIFGDDYDTEDGTGVRDYIHVEDLAMGHVKALNNMNGLNVYNLGTGNGYSVLEMVNTFMDVNKINVNYKIAPRRDGDIAMCYADSSKAYEELGWKAEKNLQDMVSSAYKYAVNNKK
jgi:UDP-glucose 4-epimerase